MSLKYILLILCIRTSLFGFDFYDIHESGEPELALPYQFVSLGGTCHTALALRGNHLRNAAFPFDWFITTNHEDFISVLKEDFRFFLEEECFAKLYGYPANVNLYHNFNFPHDFDYKTDQKRMAQWLDFKHRYTRRIARFRKLRDYAGTVFFVRTIWSELSEGLNGEFEENTQRASELKAALDAYFPNLNFKLIILSYEDINIPKMKEIDGVIEFQLGRSYANFREKANEMLISLGFEELPRLSHF